MINFVAWFFDGIGTEIALLVLGLLIGGGGGYFLGLKVKSRQYQKASNNSKQKQIITISNETNHKTKKVKDESYINQTQISKDKAKQVQIGEIKNEKK